MVDFKDPAEIARDFTIFLRVGAVTHGIYIWEFLTTLKYEWEIIRGRRPYRWTIWIYSASRLTTLMSIIMDQTIDHTKLTACQALITLTFIFPNISLAFSSLLILLRISPIWNKNKIAVSLATGVWLTNVAFLIYGAAVIRSPPWTPEGGCEVINIQSNKPTFISMLATDITLLLIMLLGLLRLHRTNGRWFDLGRFLWNQGVAWLLLATVAEVLPLLFMCLDLNDALDEMFMMPTAVTMTIAATRMYRGLSDFCFHTDVIISSGGVYRSAHAAPPRATLAISTNGKLEAAVRTTTLSSLGDKDASFVTTEGQRDDKPLELKLHGDAESKV